VGATSITLRREKMAPPRANAEGPSLGRTPRAAEATERDNKRESVGRDSHLQAPSQRTRNGSGCSLLGKTVNNTFLSENDLSKRFGVPIRTLQRWRATGDGPPYTRIGPRRVAYPAAAAEAWLVARTFADRQEELSRMGPSA
jgi:predicted DNA-binding transcriptional regulator AlpA